MHIMLRNINPTRLLRKLISVSTLSGFEEAAQNAEVDTSECNSISLAMRKTLRSQRFTQHLLCNV